MTVYGWTPNGYVAPTTQEIANDISTSIIAAIDPNLDTSPDQPMGQVIGIFANQLSSLWELGATVTSQMDPDQAEGELLDGLCALTGSRRRTATYSNCEVTLQISATTVVPEGTVLNVSGQPANRWTLFANAYNNTGSTANVANCLFQSETPGPFIANPNTLTVIATPVIGLISATNPNAAILGIPEDTDAVLRVRREEEIGASGSGNVDAIRADLLETAGVQQAFVYENTSFVTDANGTPGKSFQPVIWDGVGASAANDAVAQTIWNAKDSGILSYGLISGNAVDSQGNVRVTNFQRATQVPIYVNLTTTLNGTQSANYGSLVKAALVNYADATWNLGVEVFALGLRAQALSIQGVLDVPTCNTGTSPSPTAANNIPISGLEIATLTTSNILVDGS
jgi:Baseplate J-like protein